MPLGFSFGSKPKQQQQQQKYIGAKLSASSNDLRSGSSRSHRASQQRHQQMQAQAQLQMQMQMQRQQSQNTYDMVADCSVSHYPTAAAAAFKVNLIGKQSLTRPSNCTGFGCVQKPLREIYLGHLLSGREVDSMTERLITFWGPEMQIRHCSRGGISTNNSSISSSSSSRHLPQPEQYESFPVDSITYAELVQLHTVKGKKRHFAYFRRHSDTSDVIPDTVLIPLHKKEYKTVSKRKSYPILCLLLRRPHGIQFLECYVLTVETDSDGKQLLKQFDSFTASAMRQQQQQQQQKQNNDRAAGELFNYTPWQPGRWASQPQLPHSSAAATTAAAAAAAGTSSAEFRQPQLQYKQQQPPLPNPRGRATTSTSVTGSDASLAATPSSTSSCSGAGHSLQRQQQQQQQQAAVAAATEEVERAIRRTASGTIFEKFPELLAFNVSDYEYVGFQELRPPQPSASDNSIRHRQKNPVAEHRPSVILEESNKQRGENVSSLVHQFEQIRTDVKPVARVAPTARPPLPRQRSGGSNSSSSGSRKKPTGRSASASGHRRRRQELVSTSNPDFMNAANKF